MMEPVAETTKTVEEPKKVKSEGSSGKMTESKKVTLRDFLEGQGVPSGLVTELNAFRKEYGVEDAVKDRIIRKPSTMYMGGAVWTAAIAAILEGRNLLLEGEKATGKNVLCENLAFVFGRPTWDISMHVNIDAGSLIGAESFKNNEVCFRPGAVHNVATYGGFGVLDEINMAKNEAVAVLHAVLDDRSVIDVPGYDRIHLHEASRFIGTMNHGYVGTRELNEALVSRFVVIRVPQLDNAGLIQLITTKYPTADKSVIGYFAKLFADLQLKAKNGEIGTRSVDLRGILDSFGLIQRGVKPRESVRLCIENKCFDEFERNKVSDVINTLIPDSWKASQVFKTSDDKSVAVDFSSVK